MGELDAQRRLDDLKKKETELQRKIDDENVIGINQDKRVDELSRKEQQIRGHIDQMTQDISAVNAQINDDRTREQNAQTDLTNKKAKKDSIESAIKKETNEITQLD